LPRRGRFPYTQPWGDELGGRLVALLPQLARPAVTELSNLFTVAVIVMATCLLVRRVRTYFAGVWSGPGH
jgi:hypothetical protein